MKGENRSGFFWYAAGTVFLIAFGLVFYHFWTDSTARLALKAQKASLAGQMLHHLASASEAEKRAVLAITDEESKKYADEARAISAALGRERTDLEAVLRANGTEDERVLLAQFSKAFSEYQRVDAEVLDLAVKNTNLKAQRLTFGAAAVALGEVDGALSQIITLSAASTSPKTKPAMLEAARAEASALRIQTLLPPHIAEATNEKMDALEAQMAKEDKQVKEGLSRLAASVDQAGQSDLAKAQEGYRRYSELRSQILALSRENTNVRSLSLSLNEKRKVTMTCEDILTRLEKKIQEEPGARTPVSPR